MTHVDSQNADGHEPSRVERIEILTHEFEPPPAEPDPDLGAVDEPSTTTPERGPSVAVANAFTVDLEDWFCVQNLRGHVDPRDWHKQELRVIDSTLRLLELLDEVDVRATFFVLGWVARECPDLVREVDHRGHEIACHSNAHRMVSELTPAEFEDDLVQALDTIRDLVAQPVIGYRAPSFSITREQYWAFAIMARHGLLYDSSIFPFGGHPDYGVPDAPREIHELPAGMLEFPMACPEVFGRRVPVGGGGYFRIYPYRLTRALMRRQNAAGLPVSFYIHPWELDPGQPRLLNDAPRAKRLRHYTNLHRTESRLRRLLRDFRFETMAAVLDLGDDSVRAAGGADSQVA